MMHPSSLAYDSTFSPNDIQFHTSLLQLDNICHVKPHPFSLASQYICSIISSNPYIMQLHEALCQLDIKKQFLAAMHKELTDHIGRKHWKVVAIKALPHDKIPSPMVWSMKRKRNPVGEIIQ